MKSFPKHFSIHTTATSLDLPEPHFLQTFPFFKTIKAANTGIEQLNFISNPKYTHRNIRIHSFMLSYCLGAYHRTSILFFLVIFRHRPKQF